MFEIFGGVGGEFVTLRLRSLQLVKLLPESSETSQPIVISLSSAAVNVVVKLIESP